MRPDASYPVTQLYWPFAQEGRHRTQISEQARALRSCSFSIFEIDCGLLSESAVAFSSEGTTVTRSRILCGNVLEVQSKVLTPYLRLSS